MDKYLTSTPLSDISPFPFDPLHFPTIFPLFPNSQTLQARFSAQRTALPVFVDQRKLRQIHPPIPDVIPPLSPSPKSIDSIPQPTRPPTTATMLKLLLLLTLSLIPLVASQCAAIPSAQIAVGSKTFKNGDIVTDKALCRGQGTGAYTFGMMASLTSTGVPHRDPLNSPDSLKSGGAFAIMDNKCKLLGAFAKPDCGIPYAFKASYLKFGLSLNTINMDVGEPYFSFTYANGKYSIKNNGCVCANVGSSFNSAIKACGCSFPVNGEKGKREIAFEA